MAGAGAQSAGCMK